MRNNPVDAGELEEFEQNFKYMLRAADVPEVYAEREWPRVRKALLRIDFEKSPQDYVYQCVKRAIAGYRRRLPNLADVRARDEARTAVLQTDAAKTARIKEYVPQLLAMADKYSPATSPSAHEDRRLELQAMITDLLLPPRRIPSTSRGRQSPQLFLTEVAHKKWVTQVPPTLIEDEAERERVRSRLQKRRVRMVHTLVAFTTRLPADVRDLVLERLRQFVKTQTDISLETPEAQDTLRRMERIDRAERAEQREHERMLAAAGRGAPSSKHVLVDLYDILDQTFPGDVEIPIPVMNDLKVRTEMSPALVARRLDRAANTIAAMVPADAELTELLRLRDDAIHYFDWATVIITAGARIGAVVKRLPPGQQPRVWRRLTRALLGLT